MMIHRRAKHELAPIGLARASPLAAERSAGRNEAQPNLKVLIADDHVIFRQGLRAVLHRIDAEPVLIEAGDFTEALALAGKHPDLNLAIVDLRMPAMNGFDGVRTLRQRLPAVPILMLTASEDTEDVFRALEAGASGYLAKSAPMETLIAALRLVLIGGVYVPRTLIGVHKPPLPASEAAPPVDPDHRGALTPRQHEVVTLIAEGHSNKEIAFRLGTSDGTIKAHISAIMRQLGVRNRIQLLLAAERLGIVTRSTP